MKPLTLRFIIASALLLLSMTFVQPAMAGIVVGNTKGAVSLTEVFDYQCPHCRREYAVIQKLMANNPALELNLYPVAILNHLSLIQASSSIAAALSAKTNVPFSVLNKAYLTLPFHSEQAVYGFLNRMGANNTVLTRLMHSQTVLFQLQAGERLMHQVGAKGVPVLIVKRGDTIVAVHIGETDYVTLEKDIHRALKPFNNRSNKRS